MSASDEVDVSAEAADDEASFSQLGIAKISWQDENSDGAKIESCNEAFLRLLGFGEAVIEADKAAVISTANIALIKSILALIPPHVGGSSASGHSHGFLQKIDGSRIEASCWVEVHRTGDSLVCKLVLAPTEQAVYFSRFESKNELINAFSAVYDIVIDVDLLKGLASCVYNAIGGSALAPTEIPLDLDSAIEDWTGRYLTEEGRNLFTTEIKPLLQADQQQSPSVLHRSSIALVHGQENPIDMLVYRDGERVLLAIKVISEGSGRRSSEHQVRIRTFGYFEIFVDGSPIVFRHPKSRELFALLVDRRGGVVGSRAAAALLWDDKEPDDTVMARYRKIAMYLSDDLEEAGVSYLVESVRGNRRVNLDSVECDLLDYLRLGEKASVQFSGAYMNEYSWAEPTKGELTYRAERLRAHSGASSPTE